MALDKMAIRRKIVGVALRNARLARRRDLEDCAEVLGCSADEMRQYERGERDLSFPELEALAEFLAVPVAELLSGKLSPWPQERFRLPEARLLRNKIIGALMRKRRLEAGKSAEETAAHLGISAETLARYEKGQDPVPALTLESLAAFLGVPLSEFLSLPQESGGQTKEAEAVQESVSPDTFSHLAAELKEFIAAPRNVPYLQVAMELSRLSPQSLRAIAQALLAAQPSNTPS